VRALFAGRVVRLTRLAVAIAYELAGGCLSFRLACIGVHGEDVDASFVW
jgi:hypothetical protein